MNQTKARIEELKTNGYQLDFANVFNHTFENYKKIALYAGSMILVFSVIIITIIAVIAIGALGIAAVTSMLNPENLKPENVSPNFILFSTMTTIIVTCLLSPFPAGLIKMAYCAERDEEFHVSTIFEYYKAPYFRELFIATLIISIFSSGLTAALDFAGIQFVGSVITIATTFLTVLTIPLIIFANLSGIDAISSSISLVLKQPFVIFGLMFVGYIASFVGFIGCCIGVFFTIPFLYSMYYAMYSQIIGFDDEVNPV